MIVGKSAFFKDGSDQISLFKRIVKCEFDFPKTVDEDAQHLIKRLLKRKVTARLGNLSRGYLDVKDHDWFRKAIDFDQLNKRELKAPWIPKQTNPLDARNFNKFDKKDEREAKAVGKPLSQKEQDMFIGF